MSKPPPTLNVEGMNVSHDWNVTDGTLERPIVEPSTMLSLACLVSLLQRSARQLTYDKRMAKNLPVQQQRLEPIGSHSQVFDPNRRID
jgi:hypothetical protein